MLALVVTTVDRQLLLAGRPDCVGPECDWRQHNSLWWEIWMATGHNLGREDKWVLLMPASLSPSIAPSR